MDPPPPPATNPIPTAVVSHASYAESVESSPRSRTTETWDDRESLTAAPGGGGGGSKIRLMCSYGGHIIPRPHDKSLCYIGGDTRMVVVDRNSSLADLTSRLSKTLLNNRSFTLKYQLPNEDLDSLISVTTDEDLENMIDEFDRICASSSSAKSSRLRVFLFTKKRESEPGLSVESILGGSVKSEDWFYSALNGSGASARGLGLTDANSVNSLLGLESDASVAAVAAVNNGGNGNPRSGNSRESEAFHQADFSKNQAPLYPDSLIVETLSSFGSTASSPSLANLPPIKVRVENGGGRGVNGGGGGSKSQEQRGAMEEKFARMSVSSAAGNVKQDEGFAAMASPPPIPTTLIPATNVQGAVNPGKSGGELNDRIVSDDERSDQGVPVGYGQRQTQQQPQIQTQPQQQQQGQQQQKPSGIFDIASPDSASSDGSMLYQDPVAQIPSGMTRVTSPTDTNNLRIPVQEKVSESGYLLHTQLEQQQLQQQLQHLQQQLQTQQQQIQPQQPQIQPQQQQQLQPQQFIHPGTHYIQHPQNAMPLSQYYHLYSPPTQHHQPQLDQQQYPVYFMPPTARQPQQAYNVSMPQATYGEPANTVPTSRPQTPPVPAMVSNPSSYNNQPRNVPQGNPEMASSVYRTPIPNAQPMVQVAPGQQQHQQQYVTYSQVSYPPPQPMAQPQNPAPATNSNYAYEYSDPAHAQIYFTQPPGPAAAHPSQYQTMVSSSPMVMLSDASSGQNLNDNMKHQNRTSQAQ
uniref:PB1 domain-containing protein n=1 Tax=Kalanchoe fedtschenkoi TaxID=63787 RepID=A0A7N1A8G3_KALFE